MSTTSLVIMEGDGLGLTPVEAAGELARLAAARDPATDVYGLGGEVEQVESWFARELGKERALFMPTGTLANQLALRALAGERRRVVVQDASHVYNDTGDASQTLSALTLLPLAPDRATFTWTDIERVLQRTGSGRVAARVGVVSIESPVRRRAGELFERQEMLRICARAHERGMRTHLDGARLFIACAYTGMSPAQYAAPFDTVYVSLWKCFNSLNGAILAGPKPVLDPLVHARRMFGGALFNAWPFALLARHYAEGFVQRLARAVRVSEDFIAALPEAVRVERVSGGTNVLRMHLAQARAQGLRERLRAQGVVIAAPVDGTQGEATIGMQVNETWNRTDGARLAGVFRTALGA
ncbi:MAG: hypothetical protein IT532_06630 [Burkholderiales bacterium]|nr:hypothetical protein [Burkholderiales bacterium]